MWKVAERTNRGDFVARLETVKIGGAGSGAAILAAGRRADANVETQLLVHAGIGGHRKVAADGQRVLRVIVEDVLGLPDLGEWRIHGNFGERHLAVGRDVELQVVARLVIERRRAGLAFENEFLDEGGDVVVADDAEFVGRRGLHEAASAGGGKVEEYLAVVFASLVGFQGRRRRADAAASRR